MTIGELFKAVKAARPADREELANRLLMEIDADDRVEAESTIGEFISTLNWGYQLESD
jgi:uncharacterized protein YqgV (UPF0045/DUF77 family)